MKVKLTSRTENADQPKLQLQFSEVAPETANAGMPGMGMGINFSGWFDRAYAESLTVGTTYELTLTPAV